MSKRSGYAKWAVVDTRLDDAFVSEGKRPEDVVALARELNALPGKAGRYAPAKHVGFGRYRRLNAEGGQR